MNASPGRPRLPLLVGVAALIGVVVVGAIVIIPGVLPGPRPTHSASPAPTEGPTADTATPDGATRAFFAAVTEARRTGDARVVLEHTTGRDSSAFLTIDGFVRGQREVGKASVLSRNEVVDPSTEIRDSTATVTFTNRVEGFDIDLDNGQPLESPQVLPDRMVTVELRLVDGTWLVESFEVAL